MKRRFLSCSCWSVPVLFVLLGILAQSSSESGGHIRVSSSLPSSSSHDKLLSDSSRSKSKHLPTLKTTTAKSKASSIFDEEDDLDDYDYKDNLDDEEDYFIPKLHHSASGIPAWVTVPCPSELHGLCHCGHQRDPNDHLRKRNVVNCSYAHIEDPSFLHHIPEETEVLIVRGNKLLDLPQNIFGDARKMMDLKEFDLSENQIRVIHGKTFHHSPNLETLILNFNHLTGSILLNHPRLFSNLINLRSLHLTDAFANDVDQYSIENGLSVAILQSNLSLLQKLHLEQNRISRIPNPRLFCDLTSLMDLHLGLNSLTDLNLDLDDCLPQLRFVDVSYNAIKSVTPESGIFRILNHTNQRSELVQVDFMMNPFHCDCLLEPFLRWIKDVTINKPDFVRHRSSLRCRTGYPEENRGRILFNVERTECGPQPLSANEVMDDVSWGLLSLLIIVGVVVLSGLYVKCLGVPGWIRGLCSHNLLLRSPLLMTTPTGVKYTSVEKEEVAEVAHV